MTLQEFLKEAERLDRDAMPGPWRPEIFEVCFGLPENRNFVAYSRTMLPKACRMLRIFGEFANMHIPKDSGMYDELAAILEESPDHDLPKLREFQRALQELRIPKAPVLVDECNDFIHACYAAYRKSDCDATGPPSSREFDLHCKLSEVLGASILNCIFNGGEVIARIGKSDLQKESPDA